MKKQNKLALIAFLTVLAVVFVQYAFATTILMGDVNLDGKVTAADARLALRAGAKIGTPLSEAQAKAADVNFDGKVTAADARLILRKSAGLGTLPEPPEDSTEPTKPTDPTKPTNPTKPTKPTDPTKPTEPTDGGFKFAKDTNNGAGDGTISADAIF